MKALILIDIQQGFDDPVHFYALAALHDEFATVIRSEDLLKVG